MQIMGDIHRDQGNKKTNDIVLVIDIHYNGTIHAI